MGIKTKFNPMGGRSDSDKGNLEDWRYTNLLNGSTLLYEYVGGDWANTVYVPKVKGNAVINNYTSGTTTTASNTPFFNNPNVKSVDLQKVPFVDNSMNRAFNNCQYLTEVKNINPNVTNMYLTFDNCRSLNSLIQIPNSVTNISATFYYCYNLNQNIQIPNSVTDMRSTFYHCNNLNQNIQIPNSVTSMSDTFGFCHNLNQNIQIPNSVTSLNYTFSNCNTLNQNIQIGNSVTSMLYTFSNCIILNQNIQIPNSVTSMSGTFYNCHNLNQNIQIPNSVTNMTSTFSYCTNLNQNIQIPSSVTSMYQTFGYCTNLNQNIQIPSSVTNMQSTFYGCSKLNQAIVIPPSVRTLQDTFFYCTSLNQPITLSGSSLTNMIRTFYGCQIFNQALTIPNSVTDMSATFNYCMALNQPIHIGTGAKYLFNTFEGCSGFQSNIFIHSSEVSNANSCFMTSGLTKNVIFPLRYINNVNTITRNTLVTAATGGYAIGTAVGNLVNNTAQGAVFLAYDHVAWEGYNQWAGNGTHWILNKWAGIGKAAGTTDVVVPQEITSYATFPTAINRACFSKNAVITSIDLGTDIPWVGNAVGTGTNGKNRNAVCLNCFNIKRAYGTIRNDVTDISAAFDRCYNLTDIRVVWPDSATKSYVTYEMINATDVPPFGEGMVNMQSCFYSANSLVNYPVIPPKVTAFDTCFANGAAASARGNIFILAPGIAGNAARAVNFFRSYNASNRRNIYAYRCYSNGTNTATWTRFMQHAVYRGTSGNNTDTMYNSTSNFYVYNLSSSFSRIWSLTSGTTSTTLLEYNIFQSIPHIAVFAQYPDYNVTSIGSNCFNSASYLKTIALYNRPFNSSNIAGAFHYCSNLQIIQGLNLSGATNMYQTFYSCTNLNQNIQIPNSVTNMTYTFRDCTNLNQNIQIPNSVTSMTYTFRGCTNLQGTINILSNQVASASSCFYGTSLPKNVYIPFKYSNGVNSATFNSFVSAGYLYANGTSTGINGVTVHDWTPPVDAPAGCVLYNTSILMADKTTKEAQEVKVGDIVQTYNEDTKEFEPNKVLNIMKNRKDDIIKVTFEDNSYVELTSGHPFLTEKGWASYDNEKTIKENLYNGAELHQLEVGDKCMTQDGTYLEIINIEYEDLGTVDVYDFTIENAHTFMGGGLPLTQFCHRRRLLVLHNMSTGTY